MWWPSTTIHSAELFVLASFVRYDRRYSDDEKHKLWSGVTSTKSLSPFFSTWWLIFGLAVFWRIKIRFRPTPTMIPRSKPRKRPAMSVIKRGRRSISGMKTQMIRDCEF